MTRDREPPEGGSGPWCAVEVLRIETGQTYGVRLLSPAYVGLMGHWYPKGKGHTVYCRGDDCPRHFHSLPRIWKGYGAVEVWQRDGNLWLPMLLELTENVELDFRGRWRRGQVWQVSKPASKKGKRGGVQAVWIRDDDAAKIPPAFEIVPVLQHLYREDAFDLTARNPLRPRVMVQARPAEVAAQAEPELPAADASEEQRQKQEVLSRMREFAKMPKDPNRNGTHKGASR